jgi:DNA-binding IclR family transcriptional regulator
VEEKVSREKANPEEKVRLEEEILSLINEHPEGIKLTTIAEKTGVARIKTGNVTRMLVDEGKIMKESLFYFPV